ncbi:replication initiation associated protein [Gemycircularvirus HV-GcV2]|uniref:Replication initiation associated protein n=1 Tax=Gemycircularvirus HV-GcV2 TaxID=1862825 RepID=A0A193CDY3_9VIRU|nr:replication initiation associated protein [Gemycircularvirus HV-GcV2]ANN22659.1 replication initiation associated protein [Gemycircularvirus HV-GcV2]
MLGELGAECIVGRESHADGGLHLHAFFMFERKFESRDVRVFDVDGLHPNIVRGYTTPRKGADYAIKDGDVVAGGLDISQLGAPVSHTSAVWATIIMASTREEFFEACATLAPRSLVCSFTSLKCYADWKYRPEPVPYEHPSGLSFDTTAYPELDAWVSHALEGPECGGECPPTAEDTFPSLRPPGALRVYAMSHCWAAWRLPAKLMGVMLTYSGRRRSLVLYGPTRLGKTLWARALGSHAYFGGLFSLDESLEDVDYAVFDDMQGGLKFFHAYKFWLGAQSQFWATDKYKGKRLIHWGKPSIYIANGNPLTDEGVDHDWLLGNCDFVEITTSLLVPEVGPVTLEV